MKRILLIIAIITILFSLCACGAGKNPSETEMKKLIPQEITIDLADYPLLHEAPPTVDEIHGDTPRTFVFDESEWTPTESEYEEYGYKVYSGADGTTLMHLAEADYYQITRGTMNPDTSVSEDFLWIDYDENGNLTSYSDHKYSCYIGSESTSTYEGDELVETESFSYYDIEVRAEDQCSYRYSIDPKTTQITQIQAEQRNVDDPDHYDYLSFCYDPESEEISYITKTVSTRDGNYLCEYKSDGSLNEFTYYPNEYMAVCYIYDADYKLIKKENLG